MAAALKTETEEILKVAALRNIRFHYHIECQHLLWVLSWIFEHYFFHFLFHPTLPERTPGSSRRQRYWMNFFSFFVCWRQSAAPFFYCPAAIASKLIFVSAEQQCKGKKKTKKKKQADRLISFPQRYRQAPRSHLIHKKKGPSEKRRIAADLRAPLQLGDYSERWMETNRFNIDWAVRQWSIYTVNEMSGGLGGSDKGQ